MIAAPDDEPFCFYLVAVDGVQLKEPIWFEYIEVELIAPPHGDATVRDSFTGIVNPSYVLVHPNGRWLYAVSETSQQQEGAPSAVCALNCTTGSWNMELSNHQLSGGGWPCHLEIHSTGQWLFVSNRGKETLPGA